MQHFQLKIPVKPYIQKYLDIRFKHGIIYSSNNLIIQVVKLVLEGKTNNRLFRTRKDFTVAHYHSQITIFIPIELVKNRDIGINLSILSIKIINDLFESEFEYALDFYCNYLRHGEEKQKCLYDFCDKHNIVIDEDISFEGIKKIEYRYRKRLHAEVVKTEGELFN
jgi:hypothetical protein